MSNLTKAQQTEIKQLIEETRRDLPEGSTVYGITRRITENGTYIIEPLTFVNGAVYYLGYRFKMLAGYKITKDNYVIVGGTGFNHFAEMVEDLSASLYGRRDALNYQTL